MSRTLFQTELGAKTPNIRKDRIQLYLFAIVFLLFSLCESLRAQVLIHSVDIMPTDSEPTILEFGIRGGIGFRSKDRFERNLEGFSSTFQPGIISRTRAEGFRNLDLGDLFFRVGFSRNQRLGLVLGTGQFQKSNLTEITSDGFLTRLDFGINTNFLLFTYHYLWDIQKRWGVEAGLGFGGNETLWTASGFSGSSREYFPQEGRLRGSGISFRADSSIYFRPNDTVVFQVGLQYTHHSVPSFSGSWNGAQATFYIREDGRTTPLTESRVADTILLTNQFTRALDMNAGYLGIHFSTLLRFSY